MNGAVHGANSARKPAIADRFERSWSLLRPERVFGEVCYTPEGSLRDEHFGPFHVLARIGFGL